MAALRVKGLFLKKKKLIPLCLSVGEALGLYISQDSLEGAEAIEKKNVCMHVRDYKWRRTD